MRYPLLNGGNVRERTLSKRSFVVKETLLTVQKVSRYLVFKKVILVFFLKAIQRNHQKVIEQNLTYLQDMKTFSKTKKLSSRDA